MPEESDGLLNPHQEWMRQSHCECGALSRFARPAYGAIACHNHDGVVRRTGSACLRAGWSGLQYGKVSEFLLAPHLRLLLREILRRLNSGDRVLAEDFHQWGH